MAGSALQETAYAKINLALHVRERLANGYHRIETIFAFANDGDTIWAETADEITLEISGPFGGELSSGEDNLVMRSANELKRAFGIQGGAAIRLDKQLPIASGIGGGSADAAATLRVLSRLWQIDADERALIEIAQLLGADVAACLVSRTCRGDGVGDQIEPIDSDFQFAPLLLVNPGISLETPPVFAGWDGEDRGALTISEPISFDNNWRNDLTDPAAHLVPEIRDVLTVLDSQDGADFVGMSGSGATCFAMFDSAEALNIAANGIANAQPVWWIMRTSLR